MFYSTWNGQAWSSPQPFASANSQYWVTGSTWGLGFNGAVFRTYGRDDNVYIRSFSGSSWSVEVQLSNSGVFFAYPTVAQNEFNEVMVCWEENSVIYCRYFNPQAAQWEPVFGVTGGNLPSIVAVPNTRVFYLTYTPGDSHYIFGKQCTMGTCAKNVTDTVSNGVPPTFTVSSSVCADGTGRLFCVFENWQSGNPQAFLTTAMFK